MSTSSHILHIDNKDIGLTSRISNRTVQDIIAIKAGKGEAEESSENLVKVYLPIYFRDQAPSQSALLTLCN